jgi:ribosomal protein L40E
MSTNSQPNPHRHLSYWAAMLLAASIHQRDPRELKRHNVETCYQCGARIGRGRAGRKCRKCREVQQ